MGGGSLDCAVPAPAVADSPKAAAKPPRAQTASSPAPSVRADASRRQCRQCRREYPWIVRHDRVDAGLVTPGELRADRRPSTRRRQRLARARADTTPARDERVVERRAPTRAGQREQRPDEQTASTHAKHTQADARDGRAAALLRDAENAARDRDPVRTWPRASEIASCVLDVVRAHEAPLHEPVATERTRPLPRSPPSA